MTGSGLSVAYVLGFAAMRIIGVGPANRLCAYYIMFVKGYLRIVARYI
jgi:hypothetical protein